MATEFRGVVVSALSDTGEVRRRYEFPVAARVSYDPQGLSVEIRKDVFGHKETLLMEFPVNRSTECSRVAKKGYVFHLDHESILLTFTTDTERRKFHTHLQKVRNGKELSVFSDRTDDSSAMQYFQFYGYLSQQQNMMQDYIRTSTYQRAILANLSDFKDKVVLDVGAGSGILSFFAIQAGARKVYAVEASSMACHAETLVNANGLKGKVEVLAGKIEEIDIPEKVDVIISEPMGYMLFNERMLETYLHAKKWLLPGGKMFPTRGDLHVAPFTDDALYMEQFNKANFWYQQCFHGVDLSSLRQAAMKEYFRQPIVDTFDIRICMAKSQRHVVDFQIAKEEDLHEIEVPLEFHLLETGTVHGLAFWFDVAFSGSAQTVWLSTAPTEPLTHWYQVRCLLENPIFAKQGQLITGRALLTANKRQSYDVTIEMQVEGTGARSSNTLDLKNPYFRYTGQAPQPPPGQGHTSPSESYWNQLDVQGARQAVSMVNGITVNGMGEVSLDANQAAAANLIQLNGGWIVEVGECVQGFEGVAAANQHGLHVAATPSAGSPGRQRVAHGSATSTQAAQLIGGGISPSLFTSSTQQVVLGNTSHYPVNNSLMIGDYVTPGSVILPTQGIHTAQSFR